ncbi:MAG: glycosyltransferase [bacterium]|nr:glycosyltransferase [bacterium]
MKLLVITQKVDKNDPVLGFFHRWVEEFSKHFEFVTVICLEEGEHSLLENVRVLSLGKGKLKIENWKLKIKFRYILNFYQYIWDERNNYDSVFVHMNQEYVLLGWKFWKLWGKKIYLWRNHAKGSLLTRLAVLLSNKVFCTSPSSFTARFAKTQIMPVGIDTDFFKPDPLVQRIPNSFLFLGRIAPVKKVLEFVEWFNKLDEKSHATIAGAALLKDSDYEKLVRSRASDRIEFIGAVTQEQALKLYQSHETYVNFTPSGSMDKTIVEAAACGAKLIVHNPDLKNGFEVLDHSITALMDKLEACLEE